MFIYCICTQYLVGAPFALITASIRRGMEVISLWHCWGGMEAQVSLTVAFSSSAFLVSCFSFSSWQYPIDSLMRISGLVSLLASQAHQHHGYLTNFWCFWQCGQVPNPAEKGISIFKKLVNRRKHEVLQSFLVNGCSDVGFQKNTIGPTPADDIAPQIITDCGNLTLDFKQLGLWASPPFLQTLWPWFPNEIQNLLSSEKRTLDHWATVQFFFSLAQVRRLWW